MSEAKLTIRQDEQGGKKVQAELAATDAALARNADSLDRAAAASSRFDAEASSASSTLGGMKGGVLLVANAVADLAGKAMAAASAVAAFAAEGAKAADIGRSYAALGAAAASMADLKAATANAVDETNLQKFAMQAEAIGLTAREAEAAARAVTVLASRQGRAAEIAQIMTNSLKGSPDALRELGVVIDFSEERFKGLSEAQKKLTVALELGKAATQADLEATESQTLAMAAAKTAYDDLLSNVQIFAAEMLTSSGAQKAFAAVMATGQRLLSENKEAIAGIVSAAVSLAEIVGGNAVRSMTELAGVLGTVVQVAGPVLEIVAGMISAFNDLQSEIKAAAVDFLGLSDNTYTVGSAMADVESRFVDAANAAAALAVEARGVNEAFDIGQPATKEVVDEWERAIREGDDLAITIASIAAQSKDLKNAQADLQSLYDRFGNLEFGPLANRVDDVLKGVEEAFAKPAREIPKVTAAAKKDLDSWARFVERTMFSLTGYSPQRFWAEWKRSADDFEKRRLAIDKALTASAKMAAREQRAIEQERHREGMAAVAESARAVVAAANAEKQARLDTRDAIKQSSLDTVAAVGSEAAAYLGGGWAKAGFEAAFQTGLGISELFTPPAFGINRFLAAGQLLAAQAFAEANGASGGSKGSAAAAVASSKPAAASSAAMVRRPEQTGNGSASPMYVQLWTDDGVLASSAIRGVNKNAKRGGRKIDRRAIGSNQTRSIRG